MKQVVAVVYGGRSAEHDVSVISGRNVAAGIDSEKFEVREVKIEKNGDWLVGNRKIMFADALHGVDIVFPVLHGTYGEDGKIQGLLEMLSIPFVGCGVTASALGMDKEFSKTIWSSNGLPVVNFVATTEDVWNSEDSTTRVAKQDLIQNLKYPVFVKPANLGSSIGVTKVKNFKDIVKAIERAFEYGDKVVVEEAVENSREVEVSLFGNDKVEASTCGEIKPGNEFYDYEAKYGDTGSELFIPAKITDSLATKIRQVGIKAYKALGLCGYARADFLINGGTGEFYISEVNTIPGFTDISMFPKLWEKSGLSYKELLTKLVELGFAQYNEKLKYKT